MTIVLVWSDDAGVRGQLCAKAATFGTVHESKAEGNSDAIATGLQETATRLSVDLVMIGHTKKGKDVAPRVAGHLDWPYAAECLEISGSGGADATGGWTVGRMVLSGNSKATYTMGPKAVVTSGPKVFEGKGTGAAADVKVGDSKVKVLERKGAKHSEFDLASAPIVIGVGRGFKQQADLKLAEDLAKSFPGGAVGCSRPIAADLKWLGEEHWIGLSGHAIKPKAYIACGVSGQIQHIAGIRGSKLIIAINTNKDAPIFQVADYGVVGDLYQVIPKLVAALKK